MFLIYPKLKVSDLVKNNIELTWIQLVRFDLIWLLAICTNIWASVLSFNDSGLYKYNFYAKLLDRTFIIKANMQKSGFGWIMA